MQETPDWSIQGRIRQQEGSCLDWNIRGTTTWNNRGRALREERRPPSLEHPGKKGYKKTGRKPRNGACGAEERGRKAACWTGTFSRKQPEITRAKHQGKKAAPDWSIWG